MYARVLVNFLENGSLYLLFTMRFFIRIIRISWSKMKSAPHAVYTLTITFVIMEIHIS